MNGIKKITVPQTDPRANYLAHRGEILVATQRVLESGWYILGPELQAFEEDFAAYLGVSHVVGVGNGTDAIELALRACEVGPGDLVFTVSHTAVATVAAIERAGATPVLVDIDPATFTMDPKCLDAALRNPPRGTPKAVIPVHLYGHPCDMSAIIDLAYHRGLRVIEDCAQSHGATLKNRVTGSFGDIAAFSFYPTKNLGCLGDGGAVVSNNTKLAEAARLLRQYGWQERYISLAPGINTRLDELQAAILRVKLPHLDSENSRRRDIAAIYDEKLQGGLIRPVASHTVEHVYHQYVIRTSERRKFCDFMLRHGISTGIHYPVPVHLQPAYRGRIPLSGPNLPHTEKTCNEIVSLPMFPQMADDQIESVCNVVGCYYRANPVMTAGK